VPEKKKLSKYMQSTIYSLASVVVALGALAAAVRVHIIILIAAVTMTSVLLPMAKVV
jgi:hypothetical protein